MTKSNSETEFLIKCAAVDCFNICNQRGVSSKKGIKFFKFPRPGNKRERWIKAVNRTLPNGNLWVPNESN